MSASTLAISACLEHSSVSSASFRADRSRRRSPRSAGLLARSRPSAACTPSTWCFATETPRSRAARRRRNDGKVGFTPLFALAAITVVATLGVATDAGESPPDALQAAKAETARYHSVEQALKDGYSGVGEPCVEIPGAAMGIHDVNGPLIADGVIDPERPEILLYAPDENGELHLVGVEYFQVDADQNLATSGDRPSLFDQPFDGPMPGHGRRCRCTTACTSGSGSRIRAACSRRSIQRSPADGHTRARPNRRARV